MAVAGDLVLNEVGTYTGPTIIGGNTEIAVQNSAALGATSSSAIDSLVVTGSTGTFSLTFNGATASNIPYNASAATVQSDLQAAINSSTTLIPGGSVSVSLISSSFSSPNTINNYAIAFGGSFTGLIEPAMTGSTAAGATASAALIAAGTYNIDTQTITLTGASSGTFTLSVNGQTTSPIAFGE